MDPTQVMLWWLLFTLFRFLKEILLYVPMLHLRVKTQIQANPLPWQNTCNCFVKCWWFSNSPPDVDHSFQVLQVANQYWINARLQNLSRIKRFSYELIGIQEHFLFCTHPCLSSFSALRQLFCCSLTACCKKRDQGRMLCIKIFSKIRHSCYRR